MKFSIIIPAYNIAKYIEECAGSVLNQQTNGQFQFEIILVNDGSTDETGVICDRLAKQHSHIKTIHQANQGLSGARNTGIDVAEGDFLHVARIGVVHDLGIDEEQHRHAHLFPRLQRLLREAEALDLGEIFARRVGGDVEAGCSDHLVRRLVLGDEDRHVARADADRVGRMLGIEFPRQLRRDIRVEAHRDGIAEDFRLGSRGDRIVTLRRAAEAGHPAEEIVERHRGETQPDHRDGVLRSMLPFLPRR